MSDQMQELTAQLEKATGPDRELDVAIYRHLAYAIHSPQQYHPCDYDAASTYTSSLDVALTLVPKDWQVNSLRDGFHAAADDAVGIWWHGRGSTAAIALCIAALKACTKP